MSKPHLVAVVTGGTTGIGEGICAHLLEAGATTVNIDIAKPAPMPAGDYHFFQADLAKPDEARRAAKEVSARFQVNCLVNNAGTPTPGTIYEVTDADFDTGVNLHLRTAIILMQAFGPGMQSRRFGRVVNISSRSILGKKARTVYSGTKAALVAFTRSWALELSHDGVTVNAVSPGPVPTALFLKNNPPEIAERLKANVVVDRLGTPDDIARAVMFFLSPDNSYVTGQLLHVCGGSSLGSGPW